MTLRLAVLVAVIVLAACSAGDDTGDRAGDADATGDGMVAEVASFDLVQGRPARFLVGLFAADRTRLVGFGTVSLRFAPLEDGSASEPGDPVTATFLPIPGQHVDPDAPGPRFVSGSEGTGVYGAPDVTFDRAGFWEVTVTAEIDDAEHTATAAFEVLAEAHLPAPGDAAPATRQPLAGDPSVPARAIDSRAADDTPIPDPELHDVTVADALAAGRPVMVVVSTPTYCQSRFCGPITDSVQDLARRYGDQMAFVHLEVWRDFDAGEINPAITDWIVPPAGQDAREPWVFAIDRDGIIRERFDNVATDADLEAAVEAVLLAR